MPRNAIGAQARFEDKMKLMNPPSNTFIRDVAIGSNSFL